MYDLGCVNCNEAAYIEQQEVFDQIREDEERRRLESRPGTPETEPRP